MLEGLFYGLSTALRFNFLKYAGFFLAIGGSYVFVFRNMYLGSARLELYLGILACGIVGGVLIAFGWEPPQ
jgi:hypothetical protein